MSQSKSPHLSLILDETTLSEIDKCKSKKGASVSDALALFNCGWINSTYHAFKVGILNICKVV